MPVQSDVSPCLCTCTTAMCPLSAWTSTMKAIASENTLAGAKCSGWGACITSDGHDRPGGAIYRDVIANMLGCFFMGLLSTSDSLNLKSHASYLAVLPQRQRWQPSPPVLLGLKTGFCGSLTTFSSWYATEPTPTLCLRLY